jgi:hypothetical protein
VVPLGALVTAGLAAWLGAGGAVAVDALVMLVGGLVIMALRPELAWLGCSAPPEICLTGTDPAALEAEGQLAA